MGYTATAPLRSLFPDFVDEVSEEATRRVDERFHDELERRTPVAKMPPAYSVKGAGGMAAWLKDRKGRKPGTAKGSWKSTGPVLQPDGTWSVTEWSDDPNMPHIEYDTRPHLIRRKKPTGALRFPMGLTFLYRREVHHPGTQGQHMMRDSLAVVRAEWQRIFERVLEERAQAEQRTRVPAL